MRRPRRFRALATLALAVAVTVGVAGCTSSDEAGEPSGRRVTRVAEAGEVLGEGVMLFLATAKNLHRIADVYLGDANLDEAIAAVKKILAIPAPPDAPGAPEVEDARMDARARLATLLMRTAQLTEAARTVGDGLAEATRPSFFVGNLHTVRGEVLEAEAALVDPATAGALADPTKFRGLKRAAIEAYEQANQMFQTLQQRLHEDP